MGWLAAGVLVLVVVVTLGRWFVAMPASDLAHAVRTFLAVFGALASTGLVMFGRFGLAIVAIAATVMAVRSLLAIRRGPDPLTDGEPAGPASAVDTAWLAMRLDHGTGELAGEVKLGPFAGCRLADLDLDGLLGLLALLRREDPGSVALLEAFMDRQRPGWRDRDGPPAGEGGGVAGGDGPLDEATALAILGLAPGADAAAIRAAHRRLMARLHPDQGGSTWLASRINAARDLLLGRHG